ncbi:unnamed protein product, partial [Mesorhabditis spiculigera]
MALMMFFFMIPVGSGLGFLCGSRMGSALGHWQWGVRFTAMIGVIIDLLVIVLLREPRRQEDEPTRPERSFWRDCMQIIKIPTYILSTLGLTCVMFLTGSLEWWAPTLIEHGKAAKLGLGDSDELTDDQKNKLQTESADAWVCTVGALICIPAMGVGFPMAKDHLTVAYALFFVGITAACCNLAVVVDLQLSVIVPSRRNTANSWQALISAILGDATGPYIVGAVS